MSAVTARLPPWYIRAMAEIGVREIVGGKHNPRVVGYWKSGKVQLEVNDDETPWCAAFVCAMLEESGIRSPRTPRARGFHGGTWVQPCDHRIGSIVVLASPSRGSASGHVGFLAGVGEKRIRVLGGNQGNEVSIAPFDSSLVIGTFWPSSHDFKQCSLAPAVDDSGALVSDA